VTSPIKQQAVKSVTGSGIDDRGAALTVAQLIHLTEQSYLSHIRRAEALESKGARLKNRLFRARALECATILVDYYRRLGMTSDRDFWESRRRQCEAKAFNHRNTIADNIGAGVESDPDEEA
jgi:hypothetical protein